MPDDLTRDAMARAEAFAAAILDARLRAERARWTSLIALAQREAAPLIAAVRVLAQRSLALAEPTGPALRAEPSVTRSRGPRIGRPFAELGPLRGVVAERVILSAPLDPFMDLTALATYGGLSRRTLRKFLDLAPDAALPCFRLPGKVLVRRSDFDRWMQAYQARGRPSLTRALRELGLDTSVRTGVSSR